MLRSLYSGITGMKVNQTKLDVIGNNIANVGTTAFKASRAKFQDMLNQTAKEAMAPAVNQGGLNAAQVGMGVQLAGVDTIVKQGMMQPTSRTLDVAIDGEGYFMVGKGPTVFDKNTLNVTNNKGDDNNHYMDIQDTMEVMYTRDGSFTLDHDGNLLTSDGFRVLGYSLMENQPTPDVDIAGFNIKFISSDGLDGYTIRIGDRNAATPAATIDKINKIITIDGDFTTTATDTATTTAAALQTAITNAITSFNALADTKPEEKITGTVTVTGSAYALNSDNGNIDGEIFAKINPDSIASNGELEFVDATKELIVAKNKPFNSDKDALKTLRIPNVVYKNDELGRRVALSVRNYTIDKDGIINAVLDTGEVTALGQIAMASFKNPAGLTKLGRNLYQQSVNSGTPTIRTGVGEEDNNNDGGYGDILQGMLEMSNVDLAEQFTEMIVTSRAFQASGKVISTGDEILQDILNLKR